MFSALRIMASRRFDVECMVIDRRIIAISDIHANASAFAAGISVACSLGFDELVVLGDLLTYGCDVDETLELAQTIEHRHGAKFVLGNHDQLYIDWARGDTHYFDKLPAWLQESISWTSERIGATDLRAVVSWHPQLRFGGTLMAHANPFEYGNWGYLRDSASFGKAARCLQAGECVLGLFGHTHRHRVYVSGPGERDGGIVSCAKELDLPAQAGTIVAATVAAIGQPRDACKTASILLAEPFAQGVSLRSIAVECDLTAHLAAIGNSGMSEGTVAKLTSYFR
jgi:predicted phosphodiesterase